MKPTRIPLRRSQSYREFRCVASVADFPQVCLLVAACLCLFTSSAAAQAQQVFELRAPGSNNPSMANLTARELFVRDAAGQTTVYTRLTRYDTQDGTYIAYGSREAQRVIQWPTSNAGNMRIGTLRNGQMEFNPSRMTVHAAAANPGLRPDAWDQALGGNGFNRPDGLGAPGAVSGFERDGAPGAVQDGLTAVQLSAGDANNRLFLRSTRNGQLAFAQQANDLDSAWYVVPVGHDMVRLQQNQGNRWMALGVDPIAPAGGRARQGGFGGGAFPNGGAFGGGGAGFGAAPMAVRCSPMHQELDQLWRLQAGFGGGYCFESVLMPGYCLTCVPNDGLWLQPVINSPWQFWWPQQPVFQLPPPQFRTSAEQIVPTPPLPPVTLRIANTHSDTLMILLADRRNPSQPATLRIPAGGSETVTLERDAGSTVIQTVEVMDGLGNWNRQEFQIPVPPAVLYDMSVYEEFLQSIAIDRTGTSPNPIEDVNYQPRSIGFFLIPAGEALADRSVIDVYRAAADSQNPGAVRRLSAKDLPSSSSQTPARDPLKDLLQQFQGKRGAF